jgi:ribosomal protein S18 acetylase RimI-like enzyme
MTHAALDTAVALRPVTDEDMNFLVALYASTRADELASLDWPREQRRAFIEMQFAMQNRSYRQDYPAASFDLILLDGERGGRLYVDRQGDELRLLDVSLLRRWQNRGIGTRLLRGLQGEAATARRKVSLHVRLDNPARELYLRLGFVTVDLHGIYERLEWSAG